MHFSKEQYDIATTYFFNIRKKWKHKYNIQESSIIDNINYIDIDLKNNLLYFFYKNNFKFPTIDELIYYLWNIDLSNDLNTQDYNIIFFIIKTYILIQGTIPSISNIPHIIYFYLKYNKTPTDKELLYITINSDFKFKKDKYNLVNTHECGICFESFLYNQDIIKLDCGHIFHYNNKDCLNTSSILDWLIISSTCPICRSNIKENHEF